MPDSSPSSEHDAQREFLRLFLSAEVDLYRYVCALIPAPSEARDVVQDTALALWENFTSDLVLENRLRAAGLTPPS